MIFRNVLLDRKLIAIRIKKGVKNLNIKESNDELGTNTNALIEAEQETSITMSKHPLE